ncbi:transcription repressor OFP8-like protein [Tanacetum coccineum]
MVFKVKRGGSGRGVKEKNQVSANDAAKVVGLLSAIEEHGLSVLGDNTVKKVTENINVTGESSMKSVNFCTSTAPVGNGADVAILLESIQVISEQFVNSAYGFFLGKRVAYPVVANYVKNTWSKYGLVKSMLSSSNGLFFLQFSSEDGLDAMPKNGSWFIRNYPFILKKWTPYVNLQKEDVGSNPIWVKLHGVPMTAFSEDSLSIIATKLAGEELKDSIMVAMPKLIGEGFNMCTKIVSDVVKNLNNPRQTTRGVSVGPKVSFKSTKQVYRHVSNKNGASTSGKKKQAEVSRQEIYKLEHKILDDKLMFVDDDGNPLVPTGNVDSEIEAEVVFDETTNLMASTSFKGYGTKSLLEQWRKTKRDDDYDPYDDDLYESHDMSDHLQAICDDLDITYLAYGTLSRYKARLIANSSTQLEGIGVDETFSPVVKLGTIQTVLILATSRHLSVYQLDVKNAFLHGDLSETVYMHQPPGFRDYAHPYYAPTISHEKTLKQDNVFYEKKPKNAKKKKAHVKKHVKFHSFSSVTDNYYYDCCSSDEDDDLDDETTLFSSRSFSSDSSVSFRKRRVKTKKAKKKSGRGGCKDRKATDVIPIKVKGKLVKDSVAIVKKSSDPHEDFRVSMLEMIVERQIFGTQDLENLLKCFLSLNSEEHHRIIFEVFTEIWETLFSDYL